MLLYPRVVSVTLGLDLPCAALRTKDGGAAYFHDCVQLPLPLFQRLLCSVQSGASDFTTVYWGILRSWSAYQIFLERPEK